MDPSKTLDALEKELAHINRILSNYSVNEASRQHVAYGSWIVRRDEVERKVKSARFKRLVDKALQLNWPD